MLAAEPPSPDSSYMAGARRGCAVNQVDAKPAPDPEPKSDGRLPRRQIAPDPLPLRADDSRSAIREKLLKLARIHLIAVITARRRPLHSVITQPRPGGEVAALLLLLPLSAVGWRSTFMSERACGLNEAREFDPRQGAGQRSATPARWLRCALRRPRIKWRDAGRQGAAFDPANVLVCVLSPVSRV